MRLTFGLHIELAGKPVAPPLWALLVALERDGSLAAAARACGFSYRRAGDLRTAERFTGVRWRYWSAVAVLAIGARAALLTAHLQAVWRRLPPSSDRASTARALRRQRPRQTAYGSVRVDRFDQLTPVWASVAIGIARPAISAAWSTGRAGALRGGWISFIRADGDGRWRRLLDRTLSSVILTGGARAS
jgi:hypothetical protein